MKTALFVPCYVDQFYPHVAIADQLDQGVTLHVVIFDDQQRLQLAVAEVAGSTRLSTTYPQPLVLKYRYRAVNTGLAGERVPAMSMAMQ